MQRDSAVFWETVGKIRKTVSVLQNTLKNTGCGNLVLLFFVLLPLKVAKRRDGLYLFNRVPARDWRYKLKSIELWSLSSRTWKSIEFGQNVHKVLKKYGNPKFNDLFFQIDSWPLMTVLQMFFALCSMNKVLEKWR